MYTSSSVDLLTRWHRQVGRRKRLAPDAAPRGVGALGILVDGHRRSDLVEIEKLFVLVVHDEEFAPGRLAVRLSGYRVSRVEHGVQWGGAGNSKIFKDLALMPRPMARGMRVDSSDTALLEMALRLDRRIDQAVRFQPNVSRRRLRLPRLWAGYLRGHAENVIGSGPEFDGLCDRFKIERHSLLCRFRREHEGLALFPLEYLADELAEAVAVFADLEQFPQCHAFGLRDDRSGLVGYQGACAVDLWGNRYRRDVDGDGANKLDRRAG